MHKKLLALVVLLIGITATFIAVLRINSSGAAFLLFQPLTVSISSPTNIIADPDDHSARIRWSGSETYNYPHRFGNNSYLDGYQKPWVGGYYVSWGSVAGGFTDHAITKYRSIELQSVSVNGVTTPMDNTSPYQVKVQTISQNGDLS